MADIREQWQEARRNGYTPTQILDALQQHPVLGPKIKEARASGHSDADIGIAAMGMKQEGAEYKPEEPSARARAGRGFMDLVQGGTQLLLKRFPEAEKQYTREKDRELAAYERGRGKNAGLDLMRGGAKAAATLPAFLPGRLATPGLIPRVGANAAVGGGVGSLDYVPEGGSRAMNAALGATLAGTFSAAFGGNAARQVVANPVTGADELVEIPAGNLFNFVRAAIRPATQGGRERIVGETLTRAAGGSGAARDAAERLRTLQSAVPNVQPTAAEIAENQGIGALQGVVAGQNKGAFGTRRIDNNAARLEYLRNNGVISEADDVASARAARDAASETGFNTAREVAIQPDEQLAALLQTPAARQAIEAVNETLTNQRQPIIDLANPTVGQLHLVAQQIRQANSGGVANAAGVTRLAAGAAGDVGTGITSWLERSVPEFGDAMAAYRANSAPVNRAEMGVEIGRRLLGNQLLDEAGNYTLHPSRLGAVVNNLDGIATHASGIPRRAGDVLAPEQLTAINAVSDDLVRQQAADNAAKSVGSNTYQNLAYDSLISASGVPALSRVPGLQGAARFMYQGADEDMRAILANALLNPGRAADLIGRANPTNTQWRQLMVEQLLGRYTPGLTSQTGRDGMR